MSKVLDRHTHTQEKWSETLTALKKARKEDIKIKRLTNHSAGIESSLMERSQNFHYDDYGTPAASTIGPSHTCLNLKKPRSPADFVRRKNAYYQNVRQSDVYFDPMWSNKSSALFATVPTKRGQRRAASVQTLDKVETKANESTLDSMERDISPLAKDVVVVEELQLHKKNMLPNGFFASKLNKKSMFLPALKDAQTKKGGLPY